MKSERIYEGKIVNFRVDTVELPNRKYTKREIIEHENAVCIIPLVSDTEVLMIKQYRNAVDKVLLEFPAGLIDADEEPKEAALRELSEETGTTAQQIDYLFETYSSPGFTNEKVSFFIARNLTEQILPPDDDEFIEVCRLSIDDLIAKLDNLELEDSKAVIGALYLARSR